MNDERRQTIKDIKQSLRDLVTKQETPVIEGMERPHDKLLAAWAEFREALEEYQASIVDIHGDIDGDIDGVLSDENGYLDSIPESMTEKCERTEERITHLEEALECVNEAGEQVDELIEHIGEWIDNKLAEHLEDAHTSLDEAAA